MLEIVANFLKRLQCACKCISNYFQARSWRYNVNSEGSEIGRIWAKSLGESLWFWRWRIWVNSGNRSKLPETPLMCLQMHLQLLSGLFVKIWLNSEGRAISRFWAKRMGYNPWFWRWRIWVSAWNRSKLPETPLMCLQMHLQLLSGLFVKIWVEFRRARNRPILNKTPGI